MTEGKLAITDELLVAYLDDELDATQRIMVSATLEHDAGLRRRAAEMRLSRDLLQEGLPLPSSGGTPARLDAAAARLAAALRAQGPVRGERDIRIPLKYAVAAALAVGTLLGAAYFARQLVQSAPRMATGLGQIDPRNPLHTLLESTPGTRVLEVPREGATLRAILTFRANDGRFCREFEIAAGAGSSTGIACRENARWSTEVLLKTPATAPRGDYFTPAAGAEDPALALVFEKLTQQEPFGAADEARVIAAGWLSQGP